MRRTDVDLGTLDRKRRNELWLLVFRLARAATGSRERAEDLTQKTFLRLGTTSPWAPGEITLEAHLGGILKSVYSNEVASEVKRHERERRYVAEQAALSEVVRSPEDAMLAEEPSPEQANAACLVDKLRVKLAGRQPDVAICDLMADDTTKPAQMAKVLGCTAYEIREALKRIRRYMKTIVAAERGEDEEVT
jgi:DNA-directed RNA polymerase specialized sigma24 family protein